jgi:hypothetical protein
MASERERPTRRQIKEGRPAQQAADRLAREVGQMEQRSDEVGTEIEQARSDWQRKRADRDVPGATPPESEYAARDEAASPPEDEDENASRDKAGGENGPPGAARDDSA